jgi:hypothetical protein
MTLQHRQVVALERIADALEKLYGPVEGVSMPLAIPEPVSAAETAATSPMHTTIARKGVVTIREGDRPAPLPAEAFESEVEPMNEDDL